MDRQDSGRISSTTLRTIKPLAEPRVFCVKKQFNYKFRERNFQDCTPLARILSQARRLGFQSLVKERIPCVGFAKEEDVEFKKYDKHFVKSELYRISFFKKSFQSDSGILKCKDTDFLGYAIIKVNHISYGLTQRVVFESVIRPPRRKDNFNHTKKSFKVRVYSKYFSIKGNLYCQQNQNNSCCGHAALRSLIASTNKGDISYSEINSILEKQGFSFQREKEYKTLDVEQIKKVLENKGINFLKVGYKRNSSKQTKHTVYKYLYASVEMGCPIIFGFRREEGKSGHVIPVFGHTLNEDTWIPNAVNEYFQLNDSETGYVSSEEWCSSYIAHDDNFGSNYCIPRWFLRRNPNIHDIFVIATLPKGCILSPARAEAMAVGCLREVLFSTKKKFRIGNFWLDQLDRVGSHGKNYVVLRPVFVSGRKYINHLKKLEGWRDDKAERINSTCFQRLNLDLNKAYWVIEISLPELFSINRRKLGEIVFRADKKSKDFYKCFVMARLPAFFAISSKKPIPRMNLPFESFGSGITSHTSLLQI